MAALGIDLGTTSVKVCIVNSQSKKVLQSISKNTEADVMSNCHLGHEQDVSKILQCLHGCMLELNREYLMKVTSIGVCGQMHGCVLWRSKYYEEVSSHPCPTIHIRADNLHLSSSAVVSNLHTWQDGRCDKDFLASLPTPSSSVPISTGYGNATIAWLNSHHPKELTKYDSAGTIMDLVACGLTGNAKPKISAQNAVSWGYFNTQSHTWDLNILKSIAFPTHLLPEVTMPGGVCGVLHSPWHGIPDGVRVSASLGDLQCSVLSSVDGRSRNGAVLNIGTSSQLVVIADSAVPPPPLPPSLLCVPFFENSSLVVAASLNGGNVLQVFVEMLQKWCSDLGAPVGNLSNIFAVLIQKGQEWKRVENTPGLSTTPTLFGERHTPDVRGMVCGIPPSPPELGEVFFKTCRGLLENLRSMLPQEIFTHYKVGRILGCGSALQRNPLLQDQVSKVFSLPLEMTSSNADVGAALASLNCQQPV